MFAITRFESWADLKLAYSDRPLWAFRGQADATWPLETTLFREAQRNESTFRDLRLREDWLIYQFRRFAHHYLTDLPPDENILDWLALIQHYGGPTRLLDCSSSLYVAAFFAVESAFGDAAIWAIDLSALDLASSDVLDYSPSGDIVEHRKANNEKFHELIKKPTGTCAVINVQPDRLHERLWLQQGLFLAPTDPNESFATNLAATFRNRRSFMADVEEQIWTPELSERTWCESCDDDFVAVVKIILPKDIHREILDDLQSMNINAATLFPGLEGFARSLKFHV